MVIVVGVVMLQMVLVMVVMIQMVLEAVGVILQSFEKVEETHFSQRGKDNAMPKKVLFASLLC